jgi:hypothetical protein
LGVGAEFFFVKYILSLGANEIPYNSTFKCGEVYKITLLAKISSAFKSYWSI